MTRGGTLKRTPRKKKKEKKNLTWVYMPERGKKEREKGGGNKINASWQAKNGGTVGLRVITMTKRNERRVDSPARRVKRFEDGAAGDEEVNTLSCVCSYQPEGVCVCVCVCVCVNPSLCAPPTVTRMRVIVPLAKGVARRLLRYSHSPTRT